MRRHLVTEPPYLFKDQHPRGNSANGAPFGPELELWKDGMVVIGTDEAGRGPLAGPVVAAAACFDPDIRIPGIGDSKQISEKKRELLFDLIQEQARAWSIVEVQAERIDLLNILGATTEAMGIAVREVAQKVGAEWPTLLVDGRIPSLALGRQLNIIKGDSRSFSIGAASILAKVHRDRVMVKWGKKYPIYQFARHKGYPTEDHRSSLLQHGRCPIHRCSFTIAGPDGERVSIGELPLAKPKRKRKA